MLKINLKEVKLMNFNDFTYIVLCDGLFDAGFIFADEAIKYLQEMKRKNPRHAYSLYDVNDGDERELERIWESYKEQEEWDLDWER